MLHRLPHLGAALVAAALALSLTTLPGASATPQDPRPPRPEGGRPEGGQGPRQPSALKGHMEALEAGVEKLGTALDADDAESKVEELLAEVCQLQRVSLDAKGESPRSLGRLEGKDKDKALMSYRTQMQGLTNALFEVELALLDKDLKKAKKALGQLENIESKGHGEFKRGGGRGR